MTTILYLAGFIFGSMLAALLHLFLTVWRERRAERYASKRMAGFVSRGKFLDQEESE